MTTPNETPDACPHCQSEFLRTENHEDYFKCGTAGLSGSFETYTNQSPLCRAIEAKNKAEAALAEARDIIACQSATIRRCQESETQNAKLRGLLELFTMEHPQPCMWSNQSPTKTTCECGHFERLEKARAELEAL